MALTAIERRRVEQAVATLGRYNKSPFITDFLKRQPKPWIPQARYDKEQLCDLIKQVLLGNYRGKKKYVLKLEDLINYLDHLQKTGRQHVYLFGLPEEGRDTMLARLRDLNEVKKLLDVKEEVFGEGRLVWEAKQGPQLALVRHEPADGPSQLLLKWIQTRPFWVPKQTDEAAESGGSGKEEGEVTEAEDSAEQEELEEDEVEETQEEERAQEYEDTEEEEEWGSEKVKITVRREERAAAFFVIDLINGNCELRIQAIQGQARATRQKQLAIYRTLLAELFRIEFVGPAVLAPAIRRALIAREVNILYCSAILPEGGRFTGGEGEFPPVDVRKLEAGLTTSFPWSQPKGGIGRVELDGRLDEILIAKPLLPGQHRLVLERIRRWRAEGLEDLSSPLEPRPVNGTVDSQTPVRRRVDTTVVPPPDRPTPTQARKAIATLKAVLGGGIQPDLPSVAPGIDCATREYRQTHELEEPSGTAASPGETTEAAGAPPTSAPAYDQRPLEQFLNYIREVAQSEHSSYQREIKLVRSEEQWNSRLFVIAAALALTIFAAGSSMLLFVPAKLTIGTITALLGALTTHGTVLIRSYAKSLKTKRELIQGQQRDSHETLLAIQTALSIPDQETRSHTMTTIASSLLRRVTGVVPSSDQAG